MKEGVSETIAEAKAFNALLPDNRRKLQGLYLHYLQWFQHLKHDPVHKEVMKTRHRFMEEDSMDVEEATDRNFYLTQDEEEQNDDDDDDDK